MSVTPATRQLQSVVSGHVAGANWGQSFIAEDAFPLVNTGGEKFGYETWSNEGLEDVGNAKRAINGDTKVVDPPQNSYIEDTLDEYALTTRIDKRILTNAEINDRLRAAGGGVASTISAVDRVRIGRANRLNFNIQIQKEKAAATIAFSTANYITALTFSTGNGNAVDFKAAGLIKTIATTKRSVARLYGFEPDTFILGYDKYLDMWANPDILARITGGANNTNPAIVNFELLAAMFGVKRFLVGSAVTQPLVDPDTPDPTSAVDLWTTTSAALIYSGEFETADFASPAFAKMFYMDLPETNLRNTVQTWDSPNGKLEHLEYTEFAKPRQIMKSGALFTT
jgi:hypothetical protein